VRERAVPVVPWSTNLSFLRSPPRPGRFLAGVLASVVTTTLAGVAATGCKEDKPFYQYARPGFGSPRTKASQPVPAPSAMVAPILSHALAERDPTLDERDPAAPAADLAAEVAAFTDLPTCVKSRRVDPLLADGLDALGYENFAWDSCRTVQAIKETSRGPCDKMLATAMKQRCLADVAAASGKAEWCPLTEVFPHYFERDATCLAVARRDTRPCAALAKYDRAMCEGVVAHDPSRCGTDPRCARRVGRMKGLLPTVLSKTPAVTRLTGTLRRKDEHEPDGFHTDALEFSDEAAAGVTVLLRPVGAGLILGHPTLPVALAPGRSYLGLLGEVPEAAIAGKGGTITVARFWVHLPTGETLELNAGTQLQARAEVWADQVDAPLVLVLSGTVGGMGTPRELSLRVETWVRDRVEKTASPPPPAPGKPGSPLDHAP
jgi:hypothetical protein